MFAFLWFKIYNDCRFWTYYSFSNKLKLLIMLRFFGVAIKHIFLLKILIYYIINRWGYQQIIYYEKKSEVNFCLHIKIKLCNYYQNKNNLFVILFNST